MSKKTKLILIIVGAVLAVAIVTGGIIAIANAVKKNNQAKCEHVYGDVIVLSEPTCEQKGLSKQICTLCEYELTIDVPANGHVHQTIPYKPATCLTSGLTDGIVCEICEKILVEQVEIPALGHNVLVDPIVNPTCTATGLTEGSHCKRCNLVLVEQEEISALGHNIVEIKGYAATCVKDGLTNGSYCSRCLTVYSQQEVIEATGHSMENGACKNCTYVDYIFDDESTYTMQDVVVGEKVDGWYRLYRTTDSTDYDSLKINCIINGIVGAKEVENEEATLTVAIYNKNYAINDETKGAAFNFPLSSGLNASESVQIVYTADYVDIYLAPGINIEWYYISLDTVVYDCAYIITEDSEITAIDDGFVVKKLIANSSEV